MRALALMLLAACGPSAPRLAELEHDVFTPSCAYAGCHATAGAANGLDLQRPKTWARLVGAQATVTGKTLVVAGKPEGSYLLQRLEGNMPPAAPIDSADLARVKAWIAAGAHDD